MMTEYISIVENGICIDIKQLKKILIEDWPEFYKFYYEQGECGEDFYKIILGEIADYADGLSYETVGIVQKSLGNPNVRLDWQDYYPKLDVRSIGFAVLNFLESVSGEPIEVLTRDDIPVILEFLDTPPDKSLEAWDKWEKYWASLDYPERRRKLFEEFEALKEAVRANKRILNTERHGGMKEALDMLDKVKKEFASRGVLHEGTYTTAYDPQKVYSHREENILKKYVHYKDDSHIQLIAKGDSGHPVVEIIDEEKKIIETITFKE